MKANRRATVFGIALVVAILATAVGTWSPPQRNVPAGNASEAGEPTFPADFLTDRPPPWSIALELRVSPTALDYTSEHGDELGEVRSSIQAYLAMQYPIDALAQHVRCIVVCRTVSLYGSSVGGTTVGNVILIACRQSDGSLIPTSRICRSIDHEIAHALLYPKPRPLAFEKEWLAACGRPFDEGGILAAFADGAGIEAEPALLEAGFMNRYALSNIDEDIAEIAATGFENPSILKNCKSAYPRIWKKLQLYEQFLTTIDPRLGIAFAKARQR